MRLGFAGTPEFAVPALERLAGAHELCGVFTQPDRPAGRGRHMHASPVKSRALQLGLPVHQPPSFKIPATVELLRSLRLDALIVVAYGLILPPAALESPALGCINIHASLLPRWRGAAPVQRALLAGDPTTGVTIMRMDAGLDTGPMLAERSLDIGARDTSQSLSDRLSRLGADLIVEVVAGLVHGVRETPQPADGVTYAEKITKAEARIDWRLGSDRICRQVRAFNPWPVAETDFLGAQVRIWDAEAMDEPWPRAAGRIPGSILKAGSEGIDVACGSGALRIHRLQLAGRKPLDAREFLQAQQLNGASFASA